LNLSDTAGPTLKFVFIFNTQADENMSCIACKSTHIVSANEPNDPINRKEFINLESLIIDNMNRIAFSIAINKFLPTSSLIIIEPHEASRLVSLKVDVYRSFA
jgi:competence transcription factor ComK